MTSTRGHDVWWPLERTNAKRRANPTTGTPNWRLKPGGNVPESRLAIPDWSVETRWALSIDSAPVDDEHVPDELSESPCFASHGLQRVPRTAIRQAPTRVNEEYPTGRDRDLAGEMLSSRSTHGWSFVSTPRVCQRLCSIRPSVDSDLEFVRPALDPRKGTLRVGNSVATSAEPTTRIGWFKTGIVRRGLPISRSRCSVR